MSVGNRKSSVHTEGCAEFPAAISCNSTFVLVAFDYFIEACLVHRCTRALRDISLLDVEHWGGGVHPFKATNQVHLLLCVF